MSHFIYHLKKTWWGTAKYHFHYNFLSRLAPLFVIRWSYRNILGGEGVDFHHLDRIQVRK